MPGNHGFVRAEGQRTCCNAFANGLEYQAHLADDRVHDYLLRYQTNYVADITARYRDGEYWIKIPRVGAPAVVLEMNEADEIYRSLPIPTSTARLGSTQDAYFAIWRYPSRNALANP